MRSWRNRANPDGATFDPSGRLSPTAQAQLALLKGLLDTMLPPELKMALSPMLSPMLRKMNEHQITKVVEKIVEIADTFKTLEVPA